MVQYLGVVTSGLPDPPGPEGERGGGDPYTRRHRGLSGEGSWTEAVTFSKDTASKWELGKQQIPKPSSPASLQFSAEGLYWVTHPEAKSRNLIIVDHKVSLSEHNAGQTRVKIGSRGGTDSIQFLSYICTLFMGHEMSDCMRLSTFLYCSIAR